MRAQSAAAGLAPRRTATSTALDAGQVRRGARIVARGTDNFDPERASLWERLLRAHAGNIAAAERALHKLAPCVWLTERGRPLTAQGAFAAGIDRSHTLHSSVPFTRWEWKPGRARVRA